MVSGREKKELIYWVDYHERENMKLFNDIVEDIFGYKPIRVDNAYDEDFLLNKIYSFMTIFNKTCWDIWNGDIKEQYGSINAWRNW